jgi:RimJ/RimL family protein N-acetyltransferase
LTDPVLNAPGFALRRWAAGDLDELQVLFADADVRRYLFDDRPVDRETAAAVLAKGLASPGFWSITEDPGGTIRGFVGFFRIDASPDVELVYGLAPACWGRGLATKASGAALEWLWRNTGYSRCLARTDPPNVRSVAVMERLGMRRCPDVPGPAGQTLLEYGISRPSRSD